MTTTKDGNLESLLDYLKRSRGVDFTGYKPTSLTRRIQTRMDIVDIKDYSDYIDFLEVSPDEKTHLLNFILINVTSFFRDPPTWDYLAGHVLPRLIESRSPDRPIRVWTAGCSTGEEPYSIAMLLAERLGREAFFTRVKIYATDIDEDALNKARFAIYSEKDVEEVPAGLREKYFDRAGGNYLFNKEIRRSVIFGRHDLIQDAPISKIDLLICRNLLMYFNAETQTRVLNRLHFGLNEEGFLFLGRAEMLLTRSNIFTPVDLKMRIFTRVVKQGQRDRGLLLSHGNNPDGSNPLASQVWLREAAYNAGPIPQIAVDAGGFLMLANEVARTQFGLTAKDIGQPFKDAQLSYRPADLRTAMDRASKEQRQVKISNVEWVKGENDLHYLEIIITPMKINGSEGDAFHVTFLDNTLQVRLQQKLEQTNFELETAMQELQSTNEELETTNEELQSTIEELETTNEELQSTNEELETLNEELQSTNEELETINYEMQIRTDNLNQSNSTLESILASINGGVIVLDANMCVLMWNYQSENLWGLRGDEVAGQNLSSLDIGLPIRDLKPLIRSVLKGEKANEKVVLEATNRRGKRIQCRVTCTPMIGPGKKINGTLLVTDELAEIQPS